MRHCSLIGHAQTCDSDNDGGDINNMPKGVRNHLEIRPLGWVLHRLELGQRTDFYKLGFILKDERHECPIFIYILITTLDYPLQDCCYNNCQVCFHRKVHMV